MKVLSYSQGWNKDEVGTKNLGTVRIYMWRQIFLMVKMWGAGREGLQTWFSDIRKHLDEFEDYGIIIATIFSPGLE